MYLSLYFVTIQLVSSYLLLGGSGQSRPSLPPGPPSASPSAQPSPQPIDSSSALPSTEAPNQPSMQPSVSSSTQPYKYSPVPSPAQPKAPSTPPIDYGTITDVIGLRNDVIEQNDAHFRPVTNQSSEVVVYVTFHLLSILSVDELEQKILMNLWVNFSWVDEIRTWSPSDYGGISHLQLTSMDVWRPQVHVFNSLEDADAFGSSYSPFVLYFNGDVHWYPACTLNTRCRLSLRYFPFDQQTCDLTVHSNDFVTETIFFSTHNTAVLGGYFPHNEWLVVSTHVDADVAGFNRESHTRITMTINLSRKPEGFVLKVLIPVMILSFLSNMVFILPRSSGERASFSISVLLSLSLFLSIVSDKLPNNPDSFPLMVVYLFCLLLLSGLSVIVNVCVLARTPKLNSGDHVTDADTIWQVTQQGQHQKELLQGKGSHPDCGEEAEDKWLHVGAVGSQCLLERSNCDVSDHIWKTTAVKRNQIEPISLEGTKDDWVVPQRAVYYSVGQNEQEARRSSDKSDHEKHEVRGEVTKDKDELKNSKMAWKIRLLLQTTSKHVDIFWTVAFSVSWLVITLYFVIVFIH